MRSLLVLCLVPATAALAVAADKNPNTECQARKLSLVGTYARCRLQAAGAGQGYPLGCTGTPREV